MLDEIANGYMRSPSVDVVPGGRTPEELETLFEDALVVGDREALDALFEGGAVLVAGDERLARGAGEVARLALATWEANGGYVANPQRIVQVRDIALIVTEHGVNVARRDRAGVWQYAIVFSGR